jgi:hypothetical protein
VRSVGNPTRSTHLAVSIPGIFVIFTRVARVSGANADVLLHSVLRGATNRSIRAVLARFEVSKVANFSLGTIFAIAIPGILPRFAGANTDILSRAGAVSADRSIRAVHATLVASKDNPRNIHT